MLVALDEQRRSPSRTRPARALWRMFRVPFAVYLRSFWRALVVFASVHLILLSVYAGTTHRFHVLSIFYILNLDQFFGRPSTAMAVVVSVVAIAGVGGVALLVSGREHAERGERD